MRRILHLIVLLGIFASSFAWPSIAAQDSTSLVDLADVPLPVQALPEPGYQVMTGAYLDTDAAINLIASPRNLIEDDVARSIEELGLSRTYGLDLVLPVDRADVNADILAMVQTTVYGLDAESTAFVDLLTDFSNINYVESRESEVDGASSMTIIGPGGDMIRTVVASNNVVIDIVSLDATGEPDAIEHDLIVQGTLERLQSLQAVPHSGLSSSALTFTPSIDFFNAPQTGLHGIYRVRDGAIQPAIGELGAEDEAIPAGLVSSWYGSSIIGADQGTGISYTSVWLSSYEDESAASAGLDAIVNGDGAALDDPFFLILSGEKGTWVADDMLSVTGTINGDSYSGYVAIEQQGNVLIVIGYRTVGAMLPSSSLTDDMMTTQLGCLEAGIVCPPFELPLLATLATPISEIGPSFSSSFGWMLPLTDLDWTVTETMQQSGYDMIGLESGQSAITLESVINHHGDPVQCVLDELHTLQEFEEHSDIRLWKDSSGNTDGGSDSRHAWSTFRVEPLADERADQEYVTRIDCYRLVTSGANLVVTQIAPVDSWEIERVRGDEVRNAIAFPINGAVHGKLGLSTHDRRTAMILYPWIDRAA
ncbi:MAG: hypothetical protein M9953_09885 [Thermomicrobiales bacterium]|nr:hypothetical protein [Thermomicrobiales bacterium]